MNKIQMFLKYNIDVLKLKADKIPEDKIVREVPVWFYVVFILMGLFVMSPAIITFLGVIGLIK